MCQNFYADCMRIDTNQIYSSKNDKFVDIRFFIFMNYTHLSSEFFFGEDEFLTSLFLNLNIASDKKKKDKVKYLFSTHSNPYDFSMALTKEFN